MTIVFDIGGLSTKIAFVNEKTEIIKRDVIEYANFIEASELEQRLCDYLELNVSKVDKVCISTCGIVDEEKGEISGLSAIKNYNTNWKKIFYKYKKPVYVINDAKAATLGELNYGKGKEVDSFVLIVIGTGIGGRVVLNKQIVNSKNSLAGEFGCMISKINSDKSINNFSVEGSSNAISNVYYELSNQKIPTKEIFEKFETDKNAKLAISKIVLEISTKIVNISFVVDPELFIIGGAISQNNLFIHLVNAKCRELYEKIGLKIMFEVVASAFNNDSNIFGAYSLSK